VCVFASATSYSQEHTPATEDKPAATFGIKAGINLSSLYVNDVKDQNVKGGLVGGFYAKLPIAPGLSLQPELLYLSKGAKVTYDNLLMGQGEYQFNLNYIELPLTLIVNVTKNFNINAGGYAAYLTSASIKNVKDGNMVGVTNLTADNFNRLDYGLVGGVGIDVDNLGFGLRYNYGLKEVGQSGNLSGDLTKNSKNSTLSITFSISF
jgi:hypothetical protein